MVALAQTLTNDLMVDIVRTPDGNPEVIYSKAVEPWPSQSGAWQTTNRASGSPLGMSVFFHRKITGKKIRGLQAR